MTELSRHSSHSAQMPSITISCPTAVTAGFFMGILGGGCSVIAAAVWWSYTTEATPKYMVRLISPWICLNTRQTT